MTTPQARPDCPPWCTDHDDATSQHYRSLRPGGIRVGLRQIEDGTDVPTLFVSCVPVEDPGSAVGQCDARAMARLMRDLGREDIAAAVEELAALAAGQDGAR